MTLVMRMICSAAFVCVTTLAFAPSLLGEERKLELRWTAAEIWQRSHVNNLRLSPDGKAIELTRGLLVENDGDAAGYSYKPNEEVLGEGITAFQRLKIEIPRPLLINSPKESPKLPLQAFLLVGHTGKELTANINGTAVKLPEPTFAGRYWKQFEIPGKLLTDGENEIGLSGNGKLWIARDDERASSLYEDGPREQQSYKVSKDSAEPRSKKLGPKHDIAGEYYTRLYLDGYYGSGHLRTAMFDAADLQGTGHPPLRVRVKQIRIKADIQGTDPHVGISHAPVDGIAGSASGASEYVLTAEEGKSLPRYFSADVTLRARNLQVVPQLLSLHIETEVATEPDWGEKLKVTSSQPTTLINSEYWFNFEALDHPRLAELRKQYNLDDVVKGCTTDLQRMEKLAVWTSQQWTKGHLGKTYPKWDALEILKKHEDGTPIGGFCQQYNIVFLQACQSFGMAGRCVSIGSGDHGVNIRSGHEVVEIWSNELSKWVYVDGQAAWYFVDKETRTPLNLLELRERQLAAILDKPLHAESKRPVDVVVLAKSPYEWKGLQEWPAFTELRMIPHTQFLDGKLPLPLNQGMRGWFWTGHRVWTDDAYPASVLYSDRVTNTNDWNAPINQTQIWLEQQAKPGELDVRLAHNMPSFDKYLVQIDDQPAREADNSLFTWSLHKGENRLQVRAVNKLGLPGPPSWVRVEYTP